MQDTGADGVSAVLCVEFIRPDRASFSMMFTATVPCLGDSKAPIVSSATSCGKSRVAKNPAKLVSGALRQGMNNKAGGADGGIFVLYGSSRQEVKNGGSRPWSSESFDPVRG